MAERRDHGPYAPTIHRLQRVIRAYLAATGLSQRELSSRIYQHMPADGGAPVREHAGLVKDILTDRVTNPRRRTILAMASAMGLEPDDLLDVDRPLPTFDGYTPRLPPVDPAVAIPTVVWDGSQLVEIQERLLSLPRSYILQHIGASPDHLVCWPASMDGCGIARGDHVLLDHTVHLADISGPHLVQYRDRVRPEIVAQDAPVLGRIVWIGRRL